MHEQSHSAVHLTSEALHHLGFRKHRIARAARTFIKHDETTSAHLAEMQEKDEATYLSHLRQSVVTLEGAF